MKEAYISVFRYVGKKTGRRNTENHLYQRNGGKGAGIIKKRYTEGIKKQVIHKASAFR